MRVAIAGAGAVGRSIARELITNGHQVLLIDKDPGSIKPERVPDGSFGLLVVAVDPGARREGIGRELVSRLRSAARSSLSTSPTSPGPRKCWPMPSRLSVVCTSS